MMTETTPNPAAAHDEIETALANMPLSVASILRRRMGLAAITEPEPPTVPPLPEPDPTARAINPEAMQRLDAEMAAKARVKAEQEAAEAAKRATAARLESDAVAAALEPPKARARALSPVKRRVIESSVKIRGELPDDVVFQHSVFCQTVLPYRDPGEEVRTWERKQGQVSLSLEAGRIKDPQGRFVPVGLPYGPPARLMLCHLNSTALKTRSRAVEIDGSMTAYIRRLSGRPACGPDIHRFKEQLVRLSACTIRLAYEIGAHTAQINTQIVTGFDVWEERYEGERFLFPQIIVLGYDYFESLQAHAVPLDERAIAALAHSAMALDLYMWLAQRLHRVPLDRPQFIPWTALYAQFGQGYKQVKFFRRDFKTTLNQVLTQYPEARVKTDKGGMLIANSPPPVPSRHVILPPPAEG